MPLQQLKAYRFRDRALHLILIGRRCQLVQFRKPFAQRIHGRLERFPLFQAGGIVLSRNFLFQTNGVILCRRLFKADVDQQQLNQYPLIDNVPGTDRFPIGSVTIAP